MVIGGVVMGYIIGRSLSEDGMLFVAYKIVNIINNDEFQLLLKEKGKVVYDYPPHDMKLIEWNNKLYRVMRDFVEPFYIPVRKVIGLSPLDSVYQRVVDTLKDINPRSFIVGYQLAQIRDMVSDLLVNSRIESRDTITIYDKICNY